MDSVQTVESSNIKHIGYSERTLEVAFKSGGIYHYKEVPEKCFEEFVSAKSPGSYFAKHISGKFESIKLKPLPTLRPLIGEEAKALIDEISKSMLAKFHSGETGVVRLSADAVKFRNDELTKAGYQPLASGLSALRVFEGNQNEEI